MSLMSLYRALDAGIAAEANLIWLSEHGYRYLVVSREQARQFEAETAIPIETAAGATVHIQRVADPVHKEVRLYCHSKQREQKEQGINQRFCTRLEAELQKISDGLGKPRTEKRLDKLHIRRQLQEHGIQGRWSSLREILSVQHRVTASFQLANCCALHIRKTTRPETELAAIYQALNLDSLPGGVQKTCVWSKLIHLTSL